MLHSAPALLSVMVPILFLVSASEEPALVIAKVNQSVQLSIPLYPPHTIQETVWKFASASTMVKVAEIGKGPLLTYSDQFHNRIGSLNNGTTITIRHVSPRDAGKYCAEIIFANKQIHRSLFNLAVYEPTPFPFIWTEVKENTTEKCNITLHCSAPSNTSDISCTWKYRHQDSEYQPYNTGSSIQISVPPDHQDMELLCIVHNPADQKNISVHIDQLCVVTNNARMNTTHARGCYMYLRSSLTATFLCISMFFIHLSHRY